MSRLLPALVLLGLTACASVPEGVEGPAAEDLASRMLVSIGYDRWLQNTAAVRFSFHGVGDPNHYIWDRRRRLAQVEFEDVLVRYSLDDFRAQILRGGVAVSDPEERGQLLKMANSKFVNDSYWLNPLFHIRSPGVRLATVEDEAGPGLLVRFSSGGVTPGDVYLFRAGEDGRPVEMRLWVSALPFKGVRAALGGYQTTSTGVSCPTQNRLGPIAIEIHDLQMYAEFPRPAEEDPFAELLQAR